MFNTYLKEELLLRLQDYRETVTSDNYQHDAGV